ncbi:MAG: hypothetical protein ACE5HX_15235, partial [bacterium]
MIVKIKNVTIIEEINLTTYMSILLKQLFSHLFLLFLSFLLLPALLSCKKEAKPTIHIKTGGTYHIPITTDITSLDPI